MNNKIDIFITGYLRPQMSEMTLKYLKERTRYPYRLFFINNGGSDEFLINHAEEFFLVIDPGVNIGIHAAWNISLALAESDYFITTDNDILVPDVEPDWLTQLISMMDARPDFGAIALQPHQFIGLEPSRHPNDGEILYTPMVGAVARLMRRDAVWKANGWERVIRSSRNHEERHICSRLNDVGYKFGYTSKLKAFHMFGGGEFDSWGYPKEMKPEDHGHHLIWPLPETHGDIAKYDNKTWERL